MSEKKYKRPELLAPAGDFEKLQMAIHYGADAVYLAGREFGMRASSGNFDFTVIIEGKTLREVAQFVNEELATISSVVSTSTHFILKKYKENGVVMCENPEDERMLISL